MGFVRTRLSMLVVVLAVALVGVQAAVVAPVPAAVAAPARPAVKAALVRSQRLPAGSPEAPPSDRVELMDRRSATSSTFQMPDGSMETVVSAGPVHFLDQNRVWQDIDSSLVPTDTGWRNAANSFTVGLPSRLDQPVTATGAGSHIAFAVSPGPGVAPQEAVGASDGSTVTYPLGPDLSVGYTVIPSGLKENLRLASPAAARTVGFDVSVSDGDTLAASPDGGADVVGGDGKTVAMHLAAPSAIDGAGVEGPARLTVEPTSTGGHVTVVADDAYLDAPGRVWPVTIDPSVGFQGTSASTDCYISSANPTGQDCSSAFLRAGSESGVTRNTLLSFPNLNTAVPYDAVVVGSKLRLTNYSNTTANSMTVKGYRVTHNWFTSLNWTQWNGVNSWGTPGGDYDTAAGPYTDAASESRTVTAPGSTFYLYTERLAQDWVSGAAENDGILLHASAGTTNTLNFRSSEWTTTAEQPQLFIDWRSRNGAAGPYSFQKVSLTDRAGLGVNRANGNPVISSTDFNIQGRGMNLSIQRFYNGLNTSPQPWTWSVGADTSLFVLTDGSVLYNAAEGGRYLFTAKAAGGFFVPPGFNATLADTGSGTYTLTDNRSQTVISFDIRGSQTVPISMTDRNGNHIDYHYTLVSGDPEIDTVTDTEGRVVTVGWTSGVITSLTDSTGRVVSYTWTGANLTTARDAANKDTLYHYDTSSRVDQITSPRLNVTKLGYVSSSDGRVNKISRFYDATHSYDTALANTPSTPGLGSTIITDPNGHATTYVYDAHDRVTKTTDALGRIHQTSYEPNSDEVHMLTDGLSAQTTLTHDSSNNLTAIQSPASSSAPGQVKATTNFTFAAGTYQPSSRLDPQGNCQAYTYDGNGNPWQTTEGSATGGSCSTVGSPVTTTQVHYGDGVLNYVQDPLGNRTIYHYTSSGDLREIEPPTPLNPTYFTPDALSRVGDTTDGKSQKTTYTYDNIDRVTQALYGGTTTCVPATCTTYTYDDNGLLSQRVDNTGTTSFGYDLLNRPTVKTLPGYSDACAFGSVIYGYDNADNLKSVCDAQGTTSYYYDNANQLDHMSEPGGSCTVGAEVKCTHFMSDNNGRRIKTTYPTTTPVVMNTTYQPNGAVSRVSATSGATTLYDLSYDYTKTSTPGTDTNLLRQVTDNVAGTNTINRYDTRNRLCWSLTTSSTSSAACGSGASTSSRYIYDDNGNLTFYTSPSNTVTTYTVNNNNELCWQITPGSFNTCNTPPTGSTAYSFDLNGSQTSSTAGYAATYNTKGQTTSATPPGGTASTYTYADADQTERTAVNTTTFDNGLQSPLRSVDASSNIIAWTRDNQNKLVSQRRSIDSNASYYYLYDGQGNVINLVDNTGTIANTYTYDPYGKQLAATETVPNPWRYRAGYFDNFHQTKFGARYYNPQTARWTQQDPSPTSIGNPHTPSRYVYASDDPINRSDPTGRFAFLEDIGQAAGAAAGALLGGGAGAAVGACAGGAIGGALSASGKATDPNAGSYTIGDLASDCVEDSGVVAITSTIISVLGDD